MSLFKSSFTFHALTNRKNDLESFWCNKSLTIDDSYSLQWVGLICGLSIVIGDGCEQQIPNCSFLADQAFLPHCFLHKDLGLKWIVVGKLTET